MPFLPAGFIDGSRVPAEMLRRLVYAATKGTTSVVLPTDLKVSALATPGPAVVVNTGTGLIVSAFANASAQSYVIASDSATTVSVPSTAGTWYVYATVRDPQYPGEPTPPSPLTDTYTDILVAQALPSNRPVMPLARIANPSGLTNITDAMITDLRHLGAPRSERRTAIFYPTADLVMFKGEYRAWPRITYMVDVPAWATNLRFIAHVNGVEYTGTDNAVAGVRGFFGPYAASQNGIVGAKGVSRQSIVVLSEWTVPLALRGTSQQLALQGNHTVGTGQITADYQSQVVYDYEFTETRS